MDKNRIADNIILAYELFLTEEGLFGGYSNLEYGETIGKILGECTEEGKDYPEREKVLLKVIEIAKQSINPDSLYIIGKAYSWSKVKYNKEAIKFLKMYLDGEISDYAIKHTIGDHIPEFSRKYMHLADTYGMLGDKYLIDYDYENALKTFNLMLENDELSKSPIGRQIPYLKIADTYRRMNRLDDSIRTLEQAKYPTDVFEKGNEFFEVDIEQEKKSFYETIERFLQDYRDKRERGYIYRPRNNKEK